MKNLTAGKIKEYFKSVVKGKVVRYKLDNIYALNFILHDSLEGGGSESIQNDAQGKTHGQILLAMDVDIPRNIYEK